MRINKSIVQEIVPGMLIKTQRRLAYFGKEIYPEYCFYILTEIKIRNGHEHEHDTLVFYGLAEERLISVYRWYLERYIGNGSIEIVA